ncbi:MAG TPA: DUF6504 family protein [Mycobacteriales bacterium]|nr:DUF6504 family protein [Mycobacteriales bacterium]
MTRLHADPVEVRTAAAEQGAVPEQFLWRGRLYVVREVLARWTAAGAWWQGAPKELDDREQQWWRVEADSGRLAALSGGRGTYDLCFSWRTGWTLKRVLD